MRWLSVKKQTAVDPAAKEPATPTVTVTTDHTRAVPRPGRPADLDRNAKDVKNAKADDDDDEPRDSARAKKGRNHRDENKPKTKAPAEKPAAPAPPPAPSPARPDAGPAMEDEDLAAGAMAPRPSVALGEAATGSADAEVLSITGSSARRRLRITTALGGGVALTADRTAPLLALSARFELGRRTLFGADASLWLASGDGGVDVQGQVLATFARRRVARWLEVGGGLGLQLGAGIGPAASLGLRYHLPPNPRAAAFLRYDGALLFDEGARAGQHAITLGLEYGF